MRSCSKAHGPREVFQQLAEKEATSVLFLPGSFDGIDPRIVDKLTIGRIIGRRRICRDHATRERE